MFHGSIVALVTPMTDEEEIDFEALEKLISMHLSNGTNAIVVMGTTGEAATLTAEEQNQVITFTVQEVAGRVPVIAGTAANSTWQAIEKTRIAMKLGVDACLLLTPAYIKPTQEGLYQHFKAIAENAAIPQILYNVPSRTACDMLPETVARLSKISNIIGIKEATDVVRAQELMRLCGESLTVYAGDDAIGLSVLLTGGRGIISVTTNVAPKLMSQMCDYALKGEYQRAIEINNQLMLLHKRLFLETNPIPVKWCLHELGLIKNKIRLPLTNFSSVHHESLREAMKVANLL